MPAISREDAKVEFADGEAELRTVQAREMTVGFVRAPHGADFRPAPEALEDSEYVDFSPPAQFREVLDHLKGQ